MKNGKGATFNTCIKSDVDERAIRKMFYKKWKEQEASIRSDWQRDGWQLKRSVRP